ncbi:MAG: T9SS type A sorting domain-containing protein [Saprospiraceae bacterium]
MLNKTYNISFLLFYITLLFNFNPAIAQDLEIWQIQGNTLTSPYAGQQVKTTAGIVTAVGNGFFFLQSPEAQSDQDPTTSDGIKIVSTQAGNRKKGDLLQVQGTVYETDGQTQIGQGNVSITLIRSGETLPPVVLLHPTFPSGAAGTGRELEAVEGMRIRFEGISTGPSDYDSMLPVVARQERSFREAGITYPGLPELPVWDGNPEVFWMLPNGLGQADNRFIAANTPVSASGVLVQQDDRYVLYPENYELETGPEPRAVRLPDENEITVASLNVRRLESTDDNLDRKSKKIARYIVEMLHNPDLIALQEVGSAAILSNLVFFIRQQSGGADYSPFLLTGNDDINVAFLAKKEVFQNIVITQLGKLETLPGGGIVFDRPPLLFRAKLAIDSEPEMAVLNLHLRSLLGIEGNNASFVREKRYAQSLAVARMVQDLQSTNLIVVGDYNAYPFSDGYVDVVNQISGQSSLGAQYPVQMIVDPPLRNLVRELNAPEQYSYVYQGNAQVIDHALVNEMIDLEVKGMAYARGNSDFPDAYAPNEQLVQRASDHDGFVVYLASAQPSALDNDLLERVFSLYPNPVRSGEKLHFTGLSDFSGSFRLTGSNGLFVYWGKANTASEIDLPDDLPPGVYCLQLQTNGLLLNRKIVILSKE